MGKTIAQVFGAIDADICNGIYEYIGKLMDGEFDSALYSWITLNLNGDQQTAFNLLCQRSTLYHILA